MKSIAQKDLAQPANWEDKIATQAELREDVESALIDGLGEAMSMLIVRDALAGCRRPAEFQRRLGMPADMIATKLDALVETRILDRRESPDDIGPEYILTEKGRELEPVLKALSRWGRDHLPVRTSSQE